jgi:hypothetical protein
MCSSAKRSFALLGLYETIIKLLYLLAYIYAPRNRKSRILKYNHRPRRLGSSRIALAPCRRLPLPSSLFPLAVSQARICVLLLHAALVSGTVAIYSNPKSFVNFLLPNLESGEG